MKKILATAVIPAKEESQTIQFVVEGALKFVEEVIVVVSSQDTETILQIEKTNASICICNEPGKGTAMRAGALASSFDLIVFLDADGSHDPRQIPSLLAPILQGDADHVAGSRMLGGSSELFYTMSEFLRLIGNHIITLALNYKFKVRLTDSQNGFRAIRKEVFLSLNTSSVHSTIEQEITTKSLKYGVLMMELPTHEYARFAGKSKISTFRDGYKHLLMLAKNLFLESNSKNCANVIDLERSRKYFGTWH
jgi:dolichol-phosphate mannosyltransferase